MQTSINRWAEDNLYNIHTVKFYPEIKGIRFWAIQWHWRITIQKSIYRVVPLTWNSRISKTNLWWRKSDQGLPEAGGAGEYLRKGLRELLTWWKCAISWLEWTVHGRMHLSKLHQNCLLPDEMVASPAGLFPGTVPSEWVNALLACKLLLDKLISKKGKRTWRRKMHVCLFRVVRWGPHKRRVSKATHGHSSEFSN